MTALAIFGGVALMTCAVIVVVMVIEEIRDGGGR